MLSLSPQRVTVSRLDKMKSYFSKYLLKNNMRLLHCILGNSNFNLSLLTYSSWYSNEYILERGDSQPKQIWETRDSKSVSFSKTSISIKFQRNSSKSWTTLTFQPDSSGTQQYFIFHFTCEDVTLQLSTPDLLFSMMVLRFLQ